MALTTAEMPSLPSLNPPSSYQIFGHGIDRDPCPAVDAPVPIARRPVLFLIWAAK